MGGAGNGVGRSFDGRCFDRIVNGIGLDRGEIGLTEINFVFRYFRTKGLCEIRKLEIQIAAFNVPGFGMLPWIIIVTTKATAGSATAVNLLGSATTRPARTIRVAGGPHCSGKFIAGQRVVFLVRSNVARAASSKRAKSASSSSPRASNQALDSADSV